MKTLSPAYAAHLLQGVTTLSLCWRVEKTNGDLVLGTEHDRNIVISDDGSSSGHPLAGIYRASAGIMGSDIKSGTDMSVDNMEVSGALQPDLFIDITAADIEAGLLNGAAVETFVVNWQNPDDFQNTIRRGYLGEISRTAEGAYRTEVRGLTQILQQMIGRTAGDSCDVEEFGDARCKFNLPAATITGTVTAVTNRRRFDTTLDLLTSSSESPYFQLGKLTFVTGDNEGFSGQVKYDAVGAVLGNLAMWENFPRSVNVGDEFLLTPGCDRRYLTCRDVHENLVNFRGPAFFAPGMDEIIRAP